MDTVKVRFLETRVVDDFRKGTPAEERYEEGTTYDLPPRSADRWVKRGAAEFADPASATVAQGASSDVGRKLTDGSKQKAPGAGEDGGKSEKAVVPTTDNTKAEIEAFAAEHGIDISAAKNKANALDLIAAALKAQAA